MIKLYAEYGKHPKAHKQRKKQTCSKCDGDHKNTSKSCVYFGGDIYYFIIIN